MPMVLSASPLVFPYHAHSMRLYQSRLQCLVSNLHRASNSKLLTATIKVTEPNIKTSLVRTQSLLSSLQLIPVVLKRRSILGSVYQVRWISLVVLITLLEEIGSGAEGHVDA